MRRLLGGLATALVALVAASPAAAFDPGYEQRNYSKIDERAASDYNNPTYQQLLTQKGLERTQAYTQIRLNDPGRDFSGNLCQQRTNGCAGDVRLYDWAKKGHGTVLPLEWTARNGSTISGHVWIGRNGPKKRPGVVITNGSVQAPEELYWYAAQTLADHGYIVLTWDPQGQGYSDTFGEGVDRNDGVPSQTGEPFFDGTEDALDFFFSTPADPYRPRASCSSGTSHVAKQLSRVASGHASAYNPLWNMLDQAHVGLAGHSLGAAAVSYVGQIDPRVESIVAWDNLSAPSTSFVGQALTCKSRSSKRPATPPIVTPALGLSADYYLTPMPYTADPTPDQIASKNGGSLAASRHGVDTGELMIRGGTHYEFSYIPNQAFGATRRGVDLVAWYTAAWFDRELRGQRSADARLLTTRWRNDALERAVDPQQPADGNLYSSYFRSRMAFNRAGGHRYVCEDLRRGCRGWTSRDGGPASFSFLAPLTTTLGAPIAGSTTSPAGAAGAPPAASKAPEPAACRDTALPASRITSLKVGRHRRGLSVRGRAADRGCVAGGRLIKVTAAVALRTPRACRFLDRAGVFGPPLPCANRNHVLATGLARWRFSTKKRLPRGRYLFVARSVDAAGNLSLGPIRRFRVR